MHALRTPRQPLPTPIYVHAKVGIVDDRWLTIGSANLNEHSLFNDTEMNIVCHDPDIVLSTRLRLWAEHLELDAATIGGDPRTVIDGTGDRSRKSNSHGAKPANPSHTGSFELPHLSRRSERLLGPLQGLLVDG